MGRKKGTGQPDPTKDRSAHEAARGRKKVTLNDIPRLLPSDEELAHYHDHINRETDRGAAVMAAALVERALEDKIRTKLDDPGEGIADSWFDGSTAPFRTFAAKITLGRALRLYDDDVEKLLVSVKNIRNAFAHGMIPLDFEHPALAAECRKLRPHDPSNKWNTRQIFGAGCLTLARLLGMHSVLKAYLTPPEF